MVLDMRHHGGCELAKRRIAAVLRIVRVKGESLLMGRNFGVGTDMHTGPNGNLFIVSLSNGAIYEIFRTPRGRQSR